MMHRLGAVHESENWTQSGHPANLSTVKRSQRLTRNGQKPELARAQILKVGKFSDIQTGGLPFCGVSSGKCNIMTGTIVVQTNAVQLYGAVPVQQRAETVHTLQITANGDLSPVANTLSALAAWKVAA
jgi:hypothetical protein